ncbi:MAG TPA: Ku protein [Nitrospira sp.]|nr:Ku protein [Nitrospira sp.]
MPARPVATGSISFGLVSIPVKLFSATRAKSVAFRLIHAKDKSRIQQKIYCPVEDALIDRSELVRGFEVEKNVIVTFTDEELKNLDAHDDHMIDIKEFVPLPKVDPVYFENSYHLGCSPESARAYRLLAHALESTARVAIAHFTMRNKEYLVLVRPYEKGLMLHTMNYADEVVSAQEIDRGQEAQVSESELELAKRLISDLTHEKFQPEQYKDNYRERVIEAAQQKVQGHEELVAPPAEAQKGKVINLYDALKASLERRGVQFGQVAKNDPAQEDEQQVEAEKTRSSMRGSRQAAAGGRGKRK